MTFDEFALGVTSKYENYLLALTGIYLTNARAGIQASPKLIAQFKADSAKLREFVIEEIGKDIIQYQKDYPSKALDALAQTVKKVTLENISVLVLDIKGSKQAKISSIKDFTGPFGTLLQNKVASPEFKVTGPSGKSYNALPYVKNEARHAAYTASLNAQLEAILTVSDTAKVTYQDKEHANNGLLFSISGSSKTLPAYADIKAKIFHHNSSAMVEHV